MNKKILLHLLLAGLMSQSTLIKAMDLGDDMSISSVDDRSEKEEKEGKKERKEQKKRRKEKKKEKKEKRKHKDKKYKKGKKRDKRSCDKSDDSCKKESGKKHGWFFSREDSSHSD